MEDRQQPWGDLPEENYYAGRPTSTFSRSVTLFPDTFFIPKIPGLPTRTIVRYAFRAQDQLVIAQAHHAEMMRQYPIVNGVEAARDALELMVYCMRKAMDHLVHGAFGARYPELLTDLDKGDLTVDSIGGVISARRKKTWPELTSVFFDEGDTATNRFLTTLNDISNCYKHGYFLPHTAMYVNLEVPNVLLFDVSSRHLQNVHATKRVHNHDAIQLMMGFQDAINRAIGQLGGSDLFVGD